MSISLDTRNVTIGRATSVELHMEAQTTADLERQRAKLTATTDQLYARVQPATLAQGAKEEASARLASLKKSASLTLQDVAGGNAEALKKTGVVVLSAVSAIGVAVLLAARSSRRSRRETHRTAREVAAHTLQALKSDVTEAL